MFSEVFRIRATYLSPISEWKLHIVRIKAICLGVFERRFRMKTKYDFGTSEWELDVFPNESYILGFSTEFSCGKADDFRIKTIYFFHSVRMRTIYYFHSSESKLYLFPQRPNQNFIFFHNSESELDIWIGRTQYVVSVPPMETIYWHYFLYSQRFPNQN